MYCYFSADFLSAIKINGIYKGKLSEDVTPLVVEIDDAFLQEKTSPVFIEILALNGKDMPLNFLLDQDFFNSPPLNVIITDLKGGYLFKFKCANSLCPFRIIAQKKFNFAVATVFKENGLKLSIETTSDFYAENLDFDCEDAQIIDFFFCGKQFLAVNFKGKNNLLYCYLLQDKVQKVFCREVESFDLSNGFTTTEIKEDIAKHKIMCEWNFNGKELILSKKQVFYKDGFNVDSLCPHTLQYAFLEELLLGGEIEVYLSNEIRQNAKYLKEYFADFLGVFPPPIFRNQNEIGLIYKKSDNFYYAEYYTFEVKENKICNIKRSD